MNIDIDLKYENTFTKKNFFYWYLSSSPFKTSIIFFLLCLVVLSYLLISKIIFHTNLDLFLYFTTVIIVLFLFILLAMSIHINQTNFLQYIFGVKNPDLILTIADSDFLLKTESIELAITRDSHFSYIINRKGIYFSIEKKVLIAFLPVENEQFHFVCKKIKEFKSHKSTNGNKFNDKQRIFPSEKIIDTTYKLSIFRYLPSTAALITAIIHCFYFPIDFPLLFILMCPFIVFSKPSYKKRVSSIFLFRQQYSLNIYENTLVLSTKYMKRFFSLDEIIIMMCTSNELQIKTTQVVFSVFENELTKEEWSLLSDKLKV